jgi:hypothetical protein
VSENLQYPTREQLRECLLKIRKMAMDSESDRMSADTIHRVTCEPFNTPEYIAQFPSARPENAEGRG